MFKKTLFFLCISYFSIAQKLEIGAGVGPTYYKGDLQPTFRILNPSVGSNLFVRYNVSKVISIKANAMIGIVQGNDEKSGNVLNQYRGYKFSNLLWDYYGQIEYNFLNFRTHNGRYEHNSTPYLFGGLGNMQFLNRQYKARDFIVGGKQNRFGPEQILPFGIGYKRIINGKWNFGFEFSTRVLLNKKTSDSFDHFPVINTTSSGTVQINPYHGFLIADPKEALLKYPNTPQKDKYFHISFSVSYLFYKVHCPSGRQFGPLKY
jgi:hypothetical protein